MSKKKGKENAVERGSRPCDRHGRRLGSENERLHSCGFSDLWSYKYLVCGQRGSTSIHDLKPTEQRQGRKKKKSKSTEVGGSEVYSAGVWVSGTYIYLVSDN